MNLQPIQNIVAEQLSAFADEYRRQLQSSVTIINSINDYLTQRKGKMLRPLLTLLSAGAAHGSIADYKIQMAVALEMLHNSSLIHDDVVDESSLRRGMETVSHRWSNQIAVLAGDFYLAKVMHLLCLHASYEERDIVSRTAIEMSEGELLQQQASRNIDLSEENYMDTIYKKTASLMASCCEVGAWSSTPLSAAPSLREYGRLFGLAFQMRDDILDYSPETETGKPCGNDIKERKMTLPLIYFFHQTSSSIQQRLSALLKQPFIGDEEASEVVDMVHRSSALEQTRQTIRKVVDQAIAQLHSLTPSPYRDGLHQLTALLIE